MKQKHIFLNELNEMMNDLKWNDKRAISIKIIKIANKYMIEAKAPLNQIKVLAFKEKTDWDLQSKYTIGRKR